MNTIRSPKLAVAGLAILLFGIILALESSSGAGVLALGVGLLGLVLALMA